MKSPFARNIASVAILASLLAACGQPGPLYMPKPPAKPAAPAPTLSPPLPPALPLSPAN